jgi:phage terminase large subunit-like protein
LSARKAIDAGERAVRFISKLTLVGDFAGQPFAPRPWQADIVRRLFGTVRPDGIRRYRRMFLALPRKQAKTTLLAGIGCYLLFGEGVGKRGQPSYSASGDRAQASLIFKTMASMIRADPRLEQLCDIYDGYKRIECKPLGNSFEALSSEAGLKHGLSPANVLFDEVHVLPNRELHDVLTTGFGARREPLTAYITTAGWDRHSLCWELWDYARKVRDGVIDDPTWLPVLYEAGPDDDWTDERVWHKVMPALGDFCSLEFLRDEYRRAKDSPAYQNRFRQLYLNQWTEQAVRWLSLDRWDGCGLPFTEAELAELDGAECYAGLDLSQTRDLTSLGLSFPTTDGVRVLSRSWAPEDGEWKREGRTADLYREWAARGHLRLTPGTVIDYDLVEADIAEDARRYQVRKLFADRAMALQLCLRLKNVHGIDVEFLPQVPMALNSPTRELERLVLCGRLRHGGNPVLRWAVSNAAIKENATGLIQLHKAKSTGRIDPVAGVVNSLAALAVCAGDEGGSVYEERGMLIL